MTPAAASGQDLTSLVRRGVGWSALNNLALRSGSLVVGIVLARVLTPQDFGVYAVALTVQAVLMTLADLGLSADLIRSEDPGRRAPTVGALGLVSGVSLTVCMAATSGVVARSMGSPGSAPVIALLSLTLALAGAGVVPFAMLQRDFRQRAIFGIGLVDFLVSTSVTLGLVLAGGGVISLAVGRIAAQCTVLALQFRLSGTRPRYRFDRDQAGSVLRFGLPIAAANMLSWALLNLDNVVIARIAGPVSLGFYVLAFNISSWPMSAIGQVVRSVALPAFARAPDSPGGGAILTRATALTWAAALPAGATLAVLAAPLVSAVYGDRWSAAVPVLVALGLFGALRVVFDLMVAYLLAQGASRSVLVLQVLWFAALVPALVAGTRWFGIAGAGWAHLAVAGLVMLPAHLVALRLVRAPVRSVLAVAWPPLPAAAVAAGAGLWASRQVDVPAGALLLGAAVAGSTYVVVLHRWVRRFLAVPARHEARVSVVIPCFNYGRFLPEAVDSVLRQRGVEVEVVVVDDASVDDSVEVARRLAGADRRVRLVQHERNLGPVATFNDGLALATGEFLVRLDADDLLTPDSLARSVAVCRALPDVGLVYGHPVHFQDRLPRARPRSRVTGWRVWHGETWLELMCRTGVNVITSPEAFMRMSVVRRVGGQVDLAHTHDMEMWMRLAAFSDVAYIEGADQACHREHGASLSEQARSTLGLTILQERLAAFEALFAGAAGDLPDAPRLRALARRTLAVEALARASYEFDRRRAPATDVTPLRDFAQRAWPWAHELPEWRALDQRMRAGGGWAVRRPWLRLRPLLRISTDWRNRRRWSRTGVHAGGALALGATRVRSTTRLGRTPHAEPQPSTHPQTQPSTQQSLEGIAS